MLMLTEALTEQPPRTTAFHRTTDFPAGDNAEFWCCADRQFVPVGDETTLCEPLSLLPEAHEITILTEAHGATQLQASGVWRLASGVWGLGGHERAG